MTPFERLLANLNLHPWTIHARSVEGAYFPLFNCFRMVTLAGGLWRSAHGYPPRDHSDHTGSQSMR
jgi:hypothetical protein